MLLPEDRKPGVKISSEADSAYLGVLDSCDPESMFIHKGENSPIALNIHFHKNLNPDYPQYLTREMDMYYHRFGKRRAAKTWLRGAPLNKLHSGDITEITFLAANHFHMNEDPSNEYGFECEIDDINEDNLSLMKGLGFTALLLNINIDIPPLKNDIASVLNIITHYNFHEIHFRLHAQASNRSTLYYWLGYLSKNRPISIEISGIENACRTIKLDEMSALMSKQDYTLAGNRFFIAKENHLVKLKKLGTLQYAPIWGVSHPDIKDWVGLGVGAMGKIGQAFYRNLYTESGYINDLSLGKLPIYCCGQHPSTDAFYTWAVIEQLICLHRISIQQHDSSNSHFQKIKRTLEETCEYGWMNKRGTNFFLESKGLNRIREICHALQQC